MSESRPSRPPARVPALLAGLLLALAASALVAQAPDPGEPPMRVYAFFLRHQATTEMLALLRPLLTPHGTVEEQPATNTLVIRDTPDTIHRVALLLEAFDHAPEDVRLEIQVIRAGPKHDAVSPPSPPGRLEDAGLPPELVSRLRGLLRYEDYQVVAHAGVSSKEGEDVTYDLGPAYSVSFRLGTVLAERRLRLQDFKITSKAPATTNKARQLEPQDLFHATLNLWRERPFALVISQNEERQEALMVTISWHRESGIESP